jgi:HEAT repeat protein
MGRLLGMGGEGFNVACKMARTPHGRVKRAAAFFFGRSDSDGARDELLLLMRDESVAVRLDALRAYARLLHPAGPEGMLWGWTLAKKAASLPQGVGAMAGMLDDPNYRVRNEAVSALGAYRNLNDEGVDAAFEKALNDSKHKVQHSAARILDSTCPKCGEKLLLSRYLQE